MSGWPSGYSAEVIVSTMFCQLEREFESHPVHFLILFQNSEKLSSKIVVSSNLVWAQKTSYPTISAHSVEEEKKRRVILARRAAPPQAAGSQKW